MEAFLERKAKGEKAREAQVQQEHQKQEAYQALIAKFDGKQKEFLAVLESEMGVDWMLSNTLGNGLERIHMDGVDIILFCSKRTFMTRMHEVSYAAETLGIERVFVKSMKDWPPLKVVDGEEEAAA